MSEDSDYLPYIDLLSSALGASLLLMIILSLRSQQGSSPLAPPLERQVWVELRSTDRPVGFRLSALTVGTNDVRTVRRRMAGTEILEAVGDEPVVAGELRFVAVPPEDEHLLASVASTPDFASLGDPAAFGPVGATAEVREFCGRLTVLRSGEGQAGLADIAAVVDACAAVVRSRSRELPPLTVRRLERFLAATAPAVARAAGAPTAAADDRPATVLVRLAAPSLDAASTYTVKVRPGLDEVRVVRTGPTTWDVTPARAAGVEGGTDGAATH